MSGKITQYILAVVLAAMGVVLLSNIALFFYQTEERRFLTAYSIKGMAIVHDGKEYTLNFDQQTQVMQQLNKAIPIPRVKIDRKAKPADFEKLIIYRFHKPELFIRPIGPLNGRFVFDAPEWNPSGHLQETGPGILNDLFPSFYDK